MLEKRWIFRQNDEKSRAKKLAADLKTPLWFAEYLTNRGLNTVSDIKNFVRPPFPESLHNPFLMKNMQKAVDRILQAKQNNEKILIYGDYDVDGTTAVASLYSFLKNYFFQIDYYLPDRFTEGYGISLCAAQWAVQEKFDLMIALDCGTRDFESIAFAQSHGVDVIVCDHHLPDVALPDAFAVLNPKQKDCPYPFKELNGCGVGFKLIQAFAETQGISLAEICNQYIDFLALSTVADVVPLVGENRFFVFYGLKQINQKPRFSFEVLLSKSNFERVKTNNPQGSVFSKKITEYELAFILAPRINAAGRMESARNAVKLLLTDNQQEISHFGDLLEANNTDRKQQQEQITEEAIAQVLASPDSQNKKTVVVFDKNWNKGVIGIVASRLVEEFYKPAVVFTQNEEVLSASCRSIDGFDIHNALSQMSELMLHFGGHSAAAGLSILPENLTPFKEKFEKIVSETIAPEILIPSVKIDTVIEQLDTLNLTLCRSIRMMAPFGVANCEPVFCTENVFDTGYARIVGKDHLKMTLRQSGSDTRIDAIAFKMSDLLPKIADRTPFHICYTIEENVWNGNSSLQVVIRDVKFL